MLPWQWVLMLIPRALILDFPHELTFIAISYHLLKQCAIYVSIYLWRKVVSFVLIVLWLWYPLNWDASDSVLGVFGKLPMRKGTCALFHGVWTCSAKVLEYWMISLLKFKLNRSWEFQRNWNVPLVFLERSWWVRFDRIYLVRFGFRNVGDIDF